MKHRAKATEVTLSNMPAFPKPEGTNWDFKGLTKREYFAIEILKAFVISASDIEFERLVEVSISGSKLFIEKLDTLRRSEEPPREKE